MSDHRWRGYSHEELHTMINGGPGVATSHPLEDQWKRMSESLARIDSDLHAALGKIGAGWEGSTADATQNALSPLAQWAGDAQQGSDVMKLSAQLQADYIADARKKMPAPVPVTTEAPDGWDIAKGVMTGPFGAADVIKQQRDHEAQEAAQDNAQAQAVKVMEDYDSSSTSNRETLGEFKEPPQVVIDTPPPAGTTNPNANVGYTGQQPPSTTGHNTTTTPSWTPPPSGPTTSQPPVVSQDTSTHTSWADPTQNKPTTSIPPTLPTHDTHTTTQKPTPGIPPVFTRPGQPTGGPGGGKLGGPGGGAGKGLAGGKAFGSMSGALGSGNSAAGKGMPMAGMADDMHANRGAAGAGAAGKGGTAGAAGAGGAGRGQGQGEDDIEHKTADYLVETDDVFGDERLVAPPVIGGAPEA
ncbi:hypothetical protein Lesp02_36890 [Lentzea sp. NBRC 105346]|uniref:PPE domain-containing protein n=1 Tax=Lentzea sp. NBRC 105346 TaxID=3032205 RepID=UPI0024A421F2|nr:PPE domain-containing protein [Lentzea sp. NBRC 105346]GLZ31501.1 hypothetical protein Lesp02_36890 [Lentzea sp. NBRC 105346]